MPNSTEEYLPKDATATPPQKIFRLAPIEDDLTRLILTARMDAICNPRLSIHARLLFVLLLDLAVRRSTNVEPGVVRISDNKLGQLIGSSRKTVSRWKLELLAANLVWTSSYYMPNAWPITMYHIAALVTKDPHAQKTSDAGLWGNGQRRGNLVRPQTPLCPKSDPCGPKTAENAQSPDMTPGKGQICPATRPINDAGQGSNVTPGKGQMCPAPGVTSGAPPASHLGRARRHIWGVPGVTFGAHKETEEGGKASIEGGKPPPAILEWESRLKKMFPRELEAIKSDLVKQLAAADSADLALRDDLKDRLGKVETQLFGRPVKRNKPAKPAPTVKTEPKPATEAELLEGARYLVETKKLHLLNGHQLTALAGVGEYPFKKDQPKTVKETIDAVLALDARRAGKESECKPTKTAE